MKWKVVLVCLIASYDVDCFDIINRCIMMNCGILHKKNLMHVINRIPIDCVHDKEIENIRIYKVHELLS